MIPETKLNKEQLLDSVAKNMKARLLSASHVHMYEDKNENNDTDNYEKFEQLFEILDPSPWPLDKIMSPSFAQEGNDRIENNSLGSSSNEPPHKKSKSAEYQENFTSSNERDLQIILPYECVASKYLKVQIELSKSINNLTFQNVDTVYNPLDYGFSAHAEFVKAYMGGPKNILFLGMNPGPYGMCQTAVPFGNIKAVTDFLKITTQVNIPIKQSEKKRILGFKCRRQEKSGKTFWDYFINLCGTPEKFFRTAFVANFIPLAFIKDTRNITPVEMRKDPAVKELEKQCSNALKEVLDLLQVKVIIAIGRYTENKVKMILKQSDKLDSVKFIYLKHPSPRSFQKEINWGQEVDSLLRKNELMQFFQ